MHKIVPIPAFNDNYIWLITQPDSTAVVVVDPGDAKPVLHYLKEHGLTCCAILITHHHADHVGGIEAIVAEYSAPVYGPNCKPIAFLTHSLEHQSVIVLDQINLSLTILETPGHTLDHIVYYGQGMLFCGDTLFAGGCGRLFEGTASQLYESLQQLAALPEDTAVYCTHEYTLNNLNFAMTVDQNNLLLQKRLNKVKALRNKDKITLPSTIKLEKQTNPFLRCDNPDVKQQIELNTQQTFSNVIDTFAALRKLKDHY